MESDSSDVQIVDDGSSSGGGAGSGSGRQLRGRPAAAAASEGLASGRGQASKAAAAAPEPAPARGGAKKADKSTSAGPGKRGAASAAPEAAPPAKASRASKAELAKAADQAVLDALPPAHKFSAFDIVEVDMGCVIPELEGSLYPAMVSQVSSVSRGVLVKLLEATPYFKEGEQYTVPSCYLRPVQRPDAWSAVCRALVERYKAVGLAGAPRVPDDAPLLPLGQLKTALKAGRHSIPSPLAKYLTDDVLAVAEAAAALEDSASGGAGEVVPEQRSSRKSSGSKGKTAGSAARKGTSTDSLEGLAVEVWVRGGWWRAVIEEDLGVCPPPPPPPAYQPLPQRPPAMTPQQAALAALAAPGSAPTAAEGSGLLDPDAALAAIQLQPQPPAPSSSSPASYSTLGLPFSNLPIRTYFGVGRPYLDANAKTAVERGLAPPSADHVSRFPSLARAAGFEPAITALGDYGVPTRDVPLIEVRGGLTVLLNRIGVVREEVRYFRVRYVNAEEVQGLGRWARNADAERDPTIVPSLRIRLAMTWGSAGNDWRPVAEPEAPATAKFTLGVRSLCTGGALASVIAATCKGAPSSSESCELGPALSGPAPLDRPVWQQHSKWDEGAKTIGFSEEEAAEDVEEELATNDDWCCVCEEPGDLLCCDGCHRSIHAGCHAPQLPAEFSAAFFCPVCLLGASEETKKRDLCAGCGMPSVELSALELEAFVSSQKSLPPLASLAPRLVQAHPDGRARLHSEWDTFQLLADGCLIPPPAVCDAWASGVPADPRQLSPFPALALTMLQPTGPAAEVATPQPRFSWRSLALGPAGVDAFVSSITQANDCYRLLAPSLHVYCDVCSAGYGGCCLVRGFGPRTAARLHAAAVAALASSGEAVLTTNTALQALKPVCHTCAGWGAPARPGPSVERIVGHRIVWAPNPLLARIKAEALLANKVALAPRTQSSAYRARDSSFLPRLSFLVQWAGHGAWLNSWEPGLWVEHVSPSNVRAYRGCETLGEAERQLGDCLLGHPPPPAKVKWRALVWYYSLPMQGALPTGRLTRALAEILDCFALAYPHTFAEVAPISLSSWKATGGVGFASDEGEGGAAPPPVARPLFRGSLTVPEAPAHALASVSEALPVRTHPQDRCGVLPQLAVGGFLARLASSSSSSSGARDGPARELAASSWLPIDTPAAVVAAVDEEETEDNVPLEELDADGQAADEGDGDDGSDDAGDEGGEGGEERGEEDNTGEGHVATFSGSGSSNRGGSAYSSMLATVSSSLPASLTRFLKRSFLVPVAVLGARVAPPAAAGGSAGPVLYQPHLLDVLERLRVRNAKSFSPVDRCRYGYDVAVNFPLSGGLASLPAGLKDQPAGSWLPAWYPFYDPTHTIIKALLTARRRVHGGTQYYIAWGGSGPEDCTWEAGEVVAVACPAAVLRFRRVNGRCMRAALRRQAASRAALTARLAGHKNGSEVALVPAAAATSPAAVMEDDIDVVDATESRPPSPALPSAASPTAGTSIPGALFTSSPAFLGGTLFPYQLDGINWLLRAHYTGINGILADEMGLGKTVQALAFLEGLYHVERARAGRGSGTPTAGQLQTALSKLDACATESDPVDDLSRLLAGEPAPAAAARAASVPLRRRALVQPSGKVGGAHLIIVPKSTMANWDREAELWTPGLRVVGYTGTQLDREVLRDHALVLTSETTGAPLETNAAGRLSTAAPTAQLTHMVPTFDALLTSYELITRDRVIFLSMTQALARAGGRKEFNCRVDGLDDHIDGIAAPRLGEVLPSGIATGVWCSEVLANIQYTNNSSSSGSEGSRGKGTGGAVPAAAVAAFTPPRSTDKQLFGCGNEVEPAATGKAAKAAAAAAAAAASSASSSHNPWGCLIVDEGHRMKSTDARLFEVLLGATFNADHRILMTGTPIQNHMGELFSLLHFLEPRVFPSRAAFEADFSGEALQAPGTRAKLQALLAPYMFRRTKAEVMKALPALHEVVVPIPLSALAAEMYRTVLDKNYETLASLSSAAGGGSSGGGATTSGGGSSRAAREVAALDRNNTASFCSSAKRNSLNNVLMDLRKICCHPYLIAGVEKSFTDRARRDNEAAGRPWTAADAYKLFLSASGKFEVLAQMLPQLAARGHRVLIFSQLRIVLDLIEKLIAGLPPVAPAASLDGTSGETPAALRKLAFGRIDGATQGRDRQRIVDAFNRPGSKLFALLITTRAGGQGLNLASADTVIVFDSDWNPHGDRQALARAHRFGQTRPVVAYRFMTEGSVEERMVSMAGAKLKVEMLATGSGEEGGAAAAPESAGSAAAAKTELTAQELSEIVTTGVKGLYSSKAKAPARVWTPATVSALVSSSVAEAARLTEAKKLALLDGGAAAATTTAEQRASPALDSGSSKPESEARFSMLSGFKVWRPSEGTGSGGAVAAASSSDASCADAASVAAAPAAEVKPEGEAEEEDANAVWRRRFEAWQSEVLAKKIEEESSRGRGKRNASKKEAAAAAAAAAEAQRAARAAALAQQQQLKLQRLQAMQQHTAALQMQAVLQSASASSGSSGSAEVVMAPSVVPPHVHPGSPLAALLAVRAGTPQAAAVAAAAAAAAGGGAAAREAVAAEDTAAAPPPAKRPRLEEPAADPVVAPSAATPTPAPPVTAPQALVSPAAFAHFQRLLAGTPSVAPPGSSAMEALPRHTVMQLACDISGADLKQLAGYTVLGPVHRLAASAALYLMTYQPDVVSSMQQQQGRNGPLC